MNKGLSKVSGQWIYFLGADDQLHNSTTLATIFSKNDHASSLLLIGKIKYNFKENDSRLIKQQNGIFSSSWSTKLWFKNSVHHQSVFYKKELFTNFKFESKYAVLADYHFNLMLFRKKVRVRFVDTIVAICGTDGLSKKYRWGLYKEEINLKSALSSQLLRPFFFLIGSIKYGIKKFGI